MPSHAQPSDVEARLGRPLADDEATQVEAYLGDAEAYILRRIPDALTKAATDPVYSAALVAVETSVCLRAARLSDHFGYVPPDTEEPTAIPTASRAQIFVKRAEWQALGARNITVRTPSAPPYPGRYREPGWYPW